MNFGTQMYPWSQWMAQEGKPYADNLDFVLQGVAAAGFDAWEQSIAGPEDAARLRPLLERHGLQMPSVYAGGALHSEGSDAAIEAILTSARAAQTLGAQVVVVNPDPLWGAPHDKDDAQLRHQAGALQRLDERLGAEGMTLAYHTHDPEMRQSAREFHHMMRATDIGLCLDAHWIWKGAGGSAVALMDIFEMYAPRVRSLHVRQSEGDVWGQVFAPQGDVPWRTIADGLRALNFSGPVMLEQSLEAATPRAIPFPQAQVRGLSNLRELFAR